MKASKLPGLQALRGLAAVMVLIGHVLAEAEHYFALPLPGDAVPWTRGVDIFFVVSGFVITLSAQRYLGRPRSFLWRRLLRVAPLYYFFTTLMVAALLLLPGAVKDTPLDFVQIVSSYAFFPHARPDGRIAPVLSLGWTLNYEIFFYAVMALCLALRRPLVTVSGLLLVLATLGLTVEFHLPQVVFWTNPLILEFLFGIALARLWQSGKTCPNPILCTLTLAFGFALLVVLDPLPLPRFLAAGLPAALIVAAATLFCPKCAVPGQLLGDASYAFYLSHRFALRAATLLLLPLLPATPLGAWAYVVMTCFFALCLGTLTHLFLERPFLRSRQSQKVVPA
ncbi:acyltransferase family protein [Sulfitobacter maritimus]|uniref:acyltransferase family protein n=1 Tax=Sulfitobacter maritimus TaxID=2741719 RepID=UPI001582FB17|nr:acyltransferase [Sulfitobacter maritimus]